MHPDFWHEAWRSGRTRFHEGAPNRFLVEHIERFGGARRVLVPLSGKTVDLSFLASKGHEVVGVELSEMAARAFFAEAGLTPVEEERGEFMVLSSGAVAIFVGDYFRTSRELLGSFDAYYDRAALIALPPDLRERYVAHTRELLGGVLTGLVVTLEYPDGAIEAPPHSVPESEVRRLFAAEQLEVLRRVEADMPRLREAGVAATECAFSVVDRATAQS